MLGFSTGEFRVSDPETRKRAMHDRVGRPDLPVAHSRRRGEPRRASLKHSIAKARLVVVHNHEIDNAGEAVLVPQSSTM